MTAIIPQAQPVPPWQLALSEAFTRPAELLEFLELPANSACSSAGDAFPFLVTRSYAARMRPGDLNDPLLRQVLPVAEENRPTPGFGSDPVGDTQAKAVTGVIHKYHGRVLLIVTGACAIHCRYCFRRHFDYPGQQLKSSRWQAALQYIAGEPSIQEVILSGGDPLVLADDKLQALIDRLAAIPHLRRLRIHSRLPIVLPSRITDTLTGILTGTQLRAVVVIHANHVNEINDEVATAILRMRQQTIPVLNQSVLLRGINDSVADQIALQENLFDAGALPYYLHLLDRTQGAAHFEVEETAALTIHDQLKRRLPGYLVPKLVREQPGQPYKITL